MFAIYFPDSPGTVSRNFVCFLSRFVSAKKTFSRSRCHGFPSSPKDKFIVNVINPYLAEVRKHPQVLHVEDGVLRKEDLKGPVKGGSTEDRLKEMEQEVFKYKKMVESGVEANFNIINELKSLYSKELKEMWSSLTALEEKERILETKMSFKTGEPLPWKRFARENMFNPNKKNEE